jgi:hypothetical protein
MELALAAATLLFALTGGQLAAEEPMPVAQPVAEAPAPPSPPAPATVVVTADEVEHRGPIVGPSGRRDRAQCGARPRSSSALVATRAPAS